VIIFYDTETTGFKPAHIVELASVIVSHEGEQWYYQEYAKPPCPIEPGASEIHGITMEKVANCDTSEQVAAQWRKNIHEISGGLGPYYFVAHNNRFDQPVVEQYGPLPAGSRFICTLRLSRKFYPDAENHKLETMYKLLGSGRPRKAHSALDDVIMGYEILEHFLRSHSIEQLADFCSESQQLTVMPFGKHKGLPMAQVPLSYMEFMLGLPDLDPDVRKTFEAQRFQRAGIR